LVLLRSEFQVFMVHKYRGWEFAVSLCVFVRFSGGTRPSERVRNTFLCHGVLSLKYSYSVDFSMWHELVLSSWDLLNFKIYKFKLRFYKFKFVGIDKCLSHPFRLFFGVGVLLATTAVAATTPKTTTSQERPMQTRRMQKKMVDRNWSR
jgi:hypothetical protein